MQKEPDVATLEDGSYFFDKLRKRVSVVSVVCFWGMLTRLIDFPTVWGSRI
jgi:hypothetical protein